MKKVVKAVALICVISMLFSAFGLIASGYEYETPKEPEKWSDPDFETDHAYSIAFVGDTQYITNGDDYYGTKKLDQIYKYIADTAEERKLEHVFVLGDITDGGYWNDGSLAGHHENPPKFGEWEVAKRAISQLDGKVSYSLCRGNHDDYAMDDYFNVPAYTDQFKDCGGFFSDVYGTHSTVRGNMSGRNPGGFVLWSAKREADTGNGRYTDSIVNSYKSVELGKHKYLFVTVDFNPTKNVVDWLSKLLASYPDHRAIITTHAYLTSDGSIISSNSGDTMYPTEYAPSKLWDVCLSKHKNVFMVVSGHVGVNDLVYSYNVGENGNKVLQVLIDPQVYDLKDVSYGGPLAKPNGIQDTGLVMYMNFSEDGNTITFDYYATLLDKELKLSTETLKVEEDKSTVLDESIKLDMASLEAFGQTSSVVDKKRLVVLNGSIRDGEYPLTRTVDVGALGKGRVNSDLVEAFSYDDKFLYFAFSANFTGDTPMLELGACGTSYTLGELADGKHNSRITLLLNNQSCEVISNASVDVPVNEKDIFCKAREDSKTGIRTYEVKISRSYLKNNSIPDDMLAYRISFTTGTRCFRFNDDALKYFGAFGINNLDWTYNYVYFGERGEVFKNPEAPKTEDSAKLPVGNTPNSYASVGVDYALDKGNSGVNIMKVPTAYKTPVANGVISDGEYSCSYVEERDPIYFTDDTHKDVVDNVFDGVGAADLKNAVLNKGYFDYDALIKGIKTEYYFAQDEENIYIATKVDSGAVYFDENKDGRADTITYGDVLIKHLKAVISRDHQIYRIGFNMNDPSECIFIQNNMNSLFDATAKGKKTLTINNNTFDITGNGIITDMYRCSVAKETGWENHSVNSIVKKGQIINQNNPGTDRYMITEMVINKAALLEVMNEKGMNYGELPNAFFFSMFQNGQVIGQLNDDKAVGWLSDGDGGYWAYNGSKLSGTIDGLDYTSEYFPDLVVFTDNKGDLTKEDINIFSTRKNTPESENADTPSSDGKEGTSGGCSSSLAPAAIVIILASASCGAYVGRKKKIFG